MQNNDQAFVIIILIQEIAVEAAKHGESCVNVAFPFRDHEKCDPSHLAKRAPLFTKMKKGIKLSKKSVEPKAG